MAVNSIKPLTAASATATTGSTTITVFGGVDCSRVYEGTLVQIGDFQVVEGIAGTAVDTGTGNSTITLRSPWAEAPTTDKLIAWNSIEGLGQAIQRARDVVANTAAIEALSGTGIVEKTGPTAYATVPITAAGKALLDDTTAANQRTTLGLGTAATADVTTSTTDTTAGRVTKVGDFGIGGYSPAVTVDVDTLFTGSHSISCNSTCPNIPIASAGMLTVYPWSTNSNAVQTYHAATGVIPRMFTRLRTANAWSAWQEIYHSGKISPNKITVTGPNQWIMDGIAVSATEIRFKRDIINKVRPPSITLSANADFNIRTTNNVDVAYGVTPVYRANTSSGVLIMDVGGLSGLNVGLDYELLSASATSSIEWD